jgi:hypothetical protein
MSSSADSVTPVLPHQHSFSLPPPPHGVEEDLAAVGYIETDVRALWAETNTISGECC